MATLSRRTVFSALTSALVCYTLILLMLPLSPIAGASTSRSSKVSNPIRLNQQMVARRQGELLIRFSCGSI